MVVNDQVTDYKNKQNTTSCAAMVSTEIYVLQYYEVSSCTVLYCTVVC